MTFSWFCQGLLLPLQHHLKVVPFSNIFWGIFTLLSTRHGGLEVGDVHIREVVRLAAVGVDGGTSVDERLHQGDELVALPLEGVVVVVDEDGVRPALMGQFESLDDPVVACDALAAQRLAVGGGLMAGHSLVDHVDERKVGVALLDGVKPLYDGLVLLLRGEAVHP